MTDKEQLIITFSPYDKYEGQKVKPVGVSKAIQANIGEDFKIVCSKFQDQLNNKLHIDKIIEVLKRENLL